MASATKTTVITVSLELSNDEAQTLCTILDMVGGDPEYSARRHTDTILAALMEVGYSTNEKAAIGTINLL